MEIKRVIVTPEVRFNYKLPPALPIPELTVVPKIEDGSLKQNSGRNKIIFFGIVSLITVCWYMKVTRDKRRERKTDNQAAEMELTELKMNSGVPMVKSDNSTFEDDIFGVI